MKCVSRSIGRRLRSLCPTDKKCWWNLPLPLFLLTVLCYPLASNFSFLEKSFQDTRLLILVGEAKKPTGPLPVFRGFPKAYADYVKDRFSLPRFYIYVDGLIKVYLFRDSPNPAIALGKDGFFFEGFGARRVEAGIVENFDNIADYMGDLPFTDEELRQWGETLRERRDWLKLRGVDYVFVLAPTKAFVYPEYLPDKLTRIKGRTRYEQLSTYLRENVDVPFIDLFPALSEAKGKRSYPLLFYKTDFHWNFYGAFIAYQEIVAGLGEFFPQYPFVPLRFDDFRLDVDEHWAHQRFMNMIGLPETWHKNEHYLTLVPKPGTALDTALDLPPEGINDHYAPTVLLGDEKKGDAVKVHLVRNPGAPVPSILLLGDSFSEKYVYFFSAHAQKVMNYRTVVNFPYQIFQHEQPTIVVQEILNMFILRPPPVNPEAIRREVRTAKAAAAQ